MLIKISDISDSVLTLPILPWKDMALASPIKSIEIKFYQNQVRQMVKTCLEEDGFGLSANQVGINRDFFVMRHNYDHFIAFFSPSWKPATGHVVVSEKEGCLSALGEIYTVERPDVIEASWWGLNEKEKPEFYRGKLSGITARCFMHEFDHGSLKTIADIGSLAINTV
jgi:peptide deformylase